MNELFYPILIPIITGLVVLVLPLGRMYRAHIALVGAIASAVWAGILTFGTAPQAVSLVWYTIGQYTFSIDLTIDMLSRIMIFPSQLMTVLIVLYSMGTKYDFQRPHEYYTYLLWTSAMATAVLLADNLLVLIVGWEIVSVLLFLMINLGDQNDREAAGKTFVISGFSDTALLCGILFLWVMTGTSQISHLNGIATGTVLNSIIYILFLIAALVKAGAIPGHSWIPAAAEHAPVSVMAFLPASLDKLLGIYLLARISLDMFVLNTALTTLLLVIGAVTVIVAVMMAIIQHDLKKLLAFHAISQVGYMVLGIGTGTVIGIIGGLFHMLNNVIYKTCLFLGAGSVEEQTGTTDLEKLGGMWKTLPVTFWCTLIAALAISGVPPLNGFASKWLVYQGLVESGQPLLLLAAMFGSALTLASFVKVVYSVFFGKRPPSIILMGKENLLIIIPMVILALLCLIFGVFAQVPLRYLIGPAAGMTVQDTPNMIMLTRALWSPSFATLLILIALLAGFILFFMGRKGSQRETTPFVGGELLDNEVSRFPGTGFYETISNIEPLKTLYRDGDQGVFDLYVLAGAYGKKMVNLLRAAHNGILSTYMSFALLGLLAIFAFLLL